MMPWPMIFLPRWMVSLLPLKVKVVGSLAFGFTSLGFSGADFTSLDLSGTASFDLGASFTGSFDLGTSLALSAGGFVTVYSRETTLQAPSSGVGSLFSAGFLSSFFTSFLSGGFLSLVS